MVNDFEKSLVFTKLDNTLDTLFPFYLLFDYNLKIMDAGRSMKKLYPDIGHRFFQDIFSFKRPHRVSLQAASILEYSTQVILIESNFDDNLVFRGQIVQLERHKCILFVGSPWITDLAELKKNELILNDFALHDSTTDMMQIIRNKDIMMEDINNLVSSLNKQKEALIIAKEQAEHSQKLKENFLANMSHEIRTPLNAIIGFSEILNKTDIAQEHREMVKVIFTASENLLSLINDILDFTKIEAGSAKLDTSPISIKNIVSDVKSIFIPKAQEKLIEFKCFIEDEVPPCVIGDSARLTQILVNLIGNALKFTEEGYVHFYCSVISHRQDEFTIEFKVVDTGIGIPEDKQDVIFDRFVQAEEQTTRKFGGTGLGLSISKMLVELFKGDITLKSQVGQGTTFIVSIPFRQVTFEQKEHKKPEDKVIQTSKFTVLLAEDNKMNQVLALRVIQAAGGEIDIAANGRIALEMLGQKEYDLILMDLQMPEMDGYTATQRIRQDIGSNIPIIALTANTLLGEKERCLDLGMNDYLSKPYKSKELIGIINKIMRDQETQEGSCQH